MVAVAVIGSSIVGGAVSAGASNRASRLAKENADTNNALQREIFARNEAALLPYQRNGASSTSAIGALLGLPGNDRNSQNAAFENFRNSAGYQEQFNEGQRAVTGSLSNRGLLDSGAAQKRLQEYGQNRANASFGDYYSRLAGQQQVALGAASAQAGVGQVYANAVTNNNSNAAQIRSNAALSNAGNINQILQSGVSAFGYGQGLKSSYGGARG